MIRRSTLFVLSILLIGSLCGVFRVTEVKASGTIYIRADGSIEGTTDISTFDNVTYTFTANIYESIVVERDDIVVDGAGYTLQGTGADYSTGIYLSGRSNVTIKNTNIKNFDYGIVFSEYPSYTSTIAGNNITANNRVGIAVYYSSNNSISGNNITNNGDGIWLSGSSNNSIGGNNITNNYYGIWLYDSSSNTLSGNNITNNYYGIYFIASSGNSIYCNSFIGNTHQVSSQGSTNVWDDSVGKGNYWSNYENEYPDAEEVDGLGIWDTPYEIDENNMDNYPIIPEFSSLIMLSLFMIATFPVALICKRKRSI